MSLLRSVGGTLGNIDLHISRSEGFCFCEDDDDDDDDDDVELRFFRFRLFPAALSAAPALIVVRNLPHLLDPVVLDPVPLLEPTSLCFLSPFLATSCSRLRTWSHLLVRERLAAAFSFITRCS